MALIARHSRTSPRRGATLLARRALGDAPLPCPSRCSPDPRGVRTRSDARAGGGARSSPTSATDGDAGDPRLHRARSTGAARSAGGRPGRPGERRRPERVSPTRPGRRSSWRPARSGLPRAGSPQYLARLQGGRRTRAGHPPARRVGIYAPGGRAPYPSIGADGGGAGAGGGRATRSCWPRRPQPDGDDRAGAAGGGRDRRRRPRLSAWAARRRSRALAYGTDERAAGRQDRRAGQHLRGAGQAAGVRRGRASTGCPARPSACSWPTRAPTSAFLAADLIAQAEHDPLAQPILLCTSREVVERMLAEAERMIEAAPRARDHPRARCAGSGAVVVTRRREPASSWRTSSRRST